MHCPSKESLWSFNYDSTNNNYIIESSYTGKKLHSKPFYIEYAESRYFKQQLIQKNKSSVKYNNEDLYYIYYLLNNKKVYLSYEDVLLNETYNNSGKVLFNSSPTPFIIQKANYNLDVLTDEKRELVSNIRDICYNKTSTCATTNNNIPLLKNNTVEEQGRCGRSGCDPSAKIIATANRVFSV